MFKNRLRKYFFYAQMTSFIFETIIEFSTAIRNVYAQLVLLNRELTNRDEAPISIIACPHRALCGHAIRDRYFSAIEDWPLHI